MERLLVWTYRDQRADEVYGSAAGRVGPGAVVSGLGRALHIGALGVRVDNYGASGWGAADLHPDAEAIHERVLTLADREAVGLVISYAKQAARPEWLSMAAAVPQPVWRANGKPLQVYADAGYRKPVLCPLAYEVEPSHVLWMQSVYARWHAAVCTLATEARSYLGRRVAPGIGPARPWQ